MIEKIRKLRSQRIIEKVRNKYEPVFGSPHIYLCEQSFNHTGSCPFTEIPKMIAVPLSNTTERNSEHRIDRFGVHNFEMVLLNGWKMQVSGLRSTADDT